MVEPQETSAEVLKPSDPQLAAVSEPTNPPAAPVEEVAGAAVAVVSPAAEDRDAKPTRHASSVRSTDKRSEHRRANVKKARAGHRRNIRRSNTNG